MADGGSDTRTGGNGPQHFDSPQAAKDWLPGYFGVPVVNAGGARSAPAGRPLKRPCCPLSVGSVAHLVGKA